MVALSALPGVTVHGTAMAEGRSGVVSFSVTGVHPHDVSTALDAGGVCVRSGHHCAQPLMRAMGVPATVRASLWVYTTLVDVERLVAAVHAAYARFADA
jgi:cysteine desulfurase/selenocysteine lyase